eukprot:TRINITY_DN100361_c0_g1_i1.p1 TRINITY_DN100361_c0_g1~~TRINITY_DN100361_c0_g1_i1.p1  ORF type:complete len:197 (-),score=33.32 TRINITY_DN100361_c0_g1_i1:73-618(-)
MACVSAGCRAFLAGAGTRTVIRTTRLLPAALSRGQVLPQKVSFCLPPHRHPQLRLLATGRGDVQGEEEQISETDFHAQADPSLLRIFDALEAADLDCIDDVGLEDGVLTVTLESGQAFVINKHFVTRQIWYASPVSGALYFSPKGGGCWQNPQGETLPSRFLEDLGKLCPEAEELEVTDFE